MLQPLWTSLQAGCACPWDYPQCCDFGRFQPELKLLSTHSLGPAVAAGAGCEQAHKRELGDLSLLPVSLHLLRRNLHLPRGKKKHYKNNILRSASGERLQLPTGGPPTVPWPSGHPPSVTLPSLRHQMLIPFILPGPPLV